MDTPQEIKNWIANLAPWIRGLCSQPQHVVGFWNDSKEAIAFLEYADTSLRAKSGADYPESILKLGICPVSVELSSDYNRKDTEQKLQAGIQEYRQKYNSFSCGSSLVSSPRGIPHPLIVCIPSIGIFSFGKDAQTAHCVSKIVCGSVKDLVGTSSDNRIEKILQDISRVYEPKTVNQSKPLLGKISLITGGASGIGLATARRLLAEGACVVIADIDREKMKEVRQVLAGEYGEDTIYALFCDVTDPESVERAFEEVCCHWAGLDILVNNAGVALSRSIEETSPQDYNRQNNIMPRGSYLCTRQAAQIMRKQGLGGDIVYIVSKNALYAGANNLAYGTAKAAQLHQARLAAVELADGQIRVNVVNPDAVVQNSGIFSHGWGADRARTYGVKEDELGTFYAQRTLLKKEILPEDIAAAVSVLVGPDLRKSTGLVINVDGGFSASMLR